ncbi:lipase family protein [Sorangium sp. So ce448]|uniref:lipase family protein n=1 Tax=Sorangium sp. So ce448 TaxID=3133314 RepID=UPI003F5F8085
MDFYTYPKPNEGIGVRSSEDVLREVKEILPADMSGQDPDRIVGRLRELLCCTSSGAELADYLVQLAPGVYDSKVAGVLAAASTWAYSDPDTFRRQMQVRICPAYYAAASFQNDALLLNPAAYMIQSADMRLGILCFRGTQLTKMIDLLTDLSSKPDPFYAVGSVHGGFLRSVRALMPPIKAWLEDARRGHGIHATGAEKNARCCGTSHRGDGSESKLKALYITGHSLGGAIAAIAAALIHADEELGAFREVLRGVYTFGQPMVGGKAFARKCHTDFGARLFRHVYHWDVVPSLPPRTMGAFEHFGQEYEATETGWQYRDGSVAQSRVGSLRVALAGLSWVMDQLQGVREQPIIRDLALLASRWTGNPPSLADHSPLNYLRTSQVIRPGVEFDPR